MLVPIVTSALTALAVAAFLRLLQRMHAFRFDSMSIPPAERLRILPFFSLRDREYGYGDVVRILEERSFKAPAGNIVRKPRYTIWFSDGGKWSTHLTLAALDGIDVRKLVLFVSRSSNVPMETVDPYPESATAFARISLRKVINHWKRTGSRGRI